MIPGFIDPGWLGSPVDVGTFVVVIAMYLNDLRPTQQQLAAAVVALARREDRVDDERLQSELEVEDRDVQALETTIIYGGGDS